MPKPFDATSSDGVFVFDSEMKPHLHESERLRQQALKENATHPCGGNVEVTPLGIRLPAAASDADIAAVKGLYFSPLSRMFLDLDSDVYGLSGAKASEGKRFDLSTSAEEIYSGLE